MKHILCTLLACASVASANIIISEVNSNGVGGDFFEIHNTGASAVDLTGWKWVDNASGGNGGPSYNGSRAFAFDAFSLAPGAVAIVVTDASGGAAGNTAFATSWGGLPGASFLTFTVPSGTGNGLGSSDLIALFNASGTFVTGVNYGIASVNVTDVNGTVALAPLKRSASLNSLGGHAGAAGGGTATESLVWNPASGNTTPYYVNASSIGGAFTNPNSATTIGTPGIIGSGAAGNLAPVFTSPSVIYGVETIPLGTDNFINTVIATDPNPGQTVTRSLINKPAWVTFTPATGQVTGTPPAAGEYTMVVRATDNGSPQLFTEQTITLTIFPYDTPILLNEYNAVSASNFLGGEESTASDTFFGRVAGNGGEWFELVVVGNGTAGSTLDLRGWKIDVLGDLGTRTIVLSQDAYWSNVVAGTVLTFTVNDTANGGADTEVHKTSALHNQGRLWSNFWIFDPAFIDQSTSTFNNRLGISNSNTQFVIRNASDSIVFGPAGEGIATGGEPPAIAGVSSTEILKLEADPIPGTDPYYSPYNDGSTSSFGSPNLWSGGADSQSFAAYTQSNSPPQITSAPVKQAYTTYSYTITTSDPNGHTVSLSASGLPDFLTLTPGASGTATLATNRPLTVADAGYHSIRIVANDGQASNNLTPQAFTLTVFHDEPTVILNEYNAVSSDNFLGGSEAASADTHFGRILGNGGDWFELVVVGDGGPGTVDLRGWSIEIGTSQAGLPFVTSDVLTLTQDTAWQTVRAGTILTFIDANTAGGGLNSEINRRDRSTTLGDSWTNIWMGDTQYVSVTGGTIDGNVVTGIRINNDDTQFLIKDADGNIVFGPVGEGIAPDSGIGSDEIFELEGDPSPSVAAFITSDDSIEPAREGYDDGSSGSTFGWPNEWKFGIAGPITLQDFTPYINEVTETPFQQWINSFPAVTNKAAGFDFDNDGRSNYEEYVFGGNPGAADGPAAPQTLGHAPATATWQFAIRDDDTIDYILKRSTDLVAWHLLPEGSNVGSAAHPDIADFLIMTVTTPPTPDNGREFFRIELDIP